VIILTWNQRDLVCKCLDSLAAAVHPSDRPLIIVVDNGSADGTAGTIRNRYPDVAVLEIGENLGYAGGNNLGIRHALQRGAQYICLLNNDVRVSLGFLTPLLEALDLNAATGVTTPLITSEKNVDQIWALGVAVDWRSGTVSRLHVGETVSDWQSRDVFEVDLAQGAAMIFKRQVVEQIGLLDEAYYLYYEEADWCLRAREAGYRILAVPASRVWHQVSATLGETSPVVDYYMLRNHLRLIDLHWSGLHRWRVLSRVIARNLLTIAAYTAKSQGGRRLPHRNARLLALRDAALGRWGAMGSDVAAACSLGEH
jgi:GT2 family glycosyltransferase